MKSKYAFKTSLKITWAYFYRTFVYGFFFILFVGIIIISFIGLGNALFSKHESWPQVLEALKNFIPGLIESNSPKIILYNIPSYLSSIIYGFLAFIPLGLVIFRKVFQLKFDNLIFNEAVPQGPYKFWWNWYWKSSLITLPFKIPMDFLYAKYPESLTVAIGIGVLGSVFYIFIEAIILHFILMKTK